MRNILFILAAIFALIFAILGYNYYTRCSKFGGVVGIIKQCTCYGVEISHPLNTRETVQGFSSTMCVGIQLPDTVTMSTPDEIPQTTSSNKNPRCYEKIETGSCRASFPAFQYNASTNSCEQGVWGGCQGNRPFETEEECQQACLN